MDVVGPLPRAFSGFMNVLVIQDVLTRWIEFIPMTKADGPVTIKHVIRYMLRYGVPDRILTDCGSNFMSKLFEEMCRVFSTKHINTTPYRPQANGENERSHAALHRLFGILQRELKSVGRWPDYCPIITYIHNTVHHVTIKRSPYEALFGHPPPIKPFGLPELECDVNDDVTTFLDIRQESLRVLTEEIRATILEVRHTSLQYVNKGRKNPEYLVGDEVLVKRDHAKLLKDRKWGPLFSNPHVITRIISDVAVETMDESDKKHTLHVDRLKKYKRPADEVGVCSQKLQKQKQEAEQPRHSVSCTGHTASMPIIIMPDVQERIATTTELGSAEKTKLSSREQIVEPPQPAGLMRSVADAVKSRIVRRSKPIPETTRQTRSMKKNQ
jgi:hypothetical protein